MATPTTSQAKETKASHKPQETPAAFPELTNWVAPKPKSALLSSPPEIRRMILANCIRRTWTKDEDGEYHYHKWHQYPAWSLSLTIPHALLQTSHQIRGESLGALAAHPDLSVTCRVVSNDDTDDWLYEHRHCPEFPRSTLDTLRLSQQASRVRRQIDELEPVVRSLRLSLIVDKDQRIIYDMDDCRAALAMVVWQAVETFQRWDCVEIDLVGLEQSMASKKKVMYGQPGPLGPYRREVWTAAAEVLKPLRNRCTVFKCTELTGKEQNCILKTLEKGP